MIPSISKPQTTRAEINGTNAQHSTGPKTTAGKQRSSLNALRHGLTGQVIVLPTDDLQAYQHHLESFHAEYEPKGATETNLVQSLADTVWRLHRVSALESNLLALGLVREPDPQDDEQVQQALAIAASLDSQTRALSNLSLHGQRLTRQFEKTLALLQDLQSKRKSEERHQLDQAATLVKLHASKGEPYHPSQDGFVFSDDQFKAFIRAKNAADQAAWAKETQRPEVRLVWTDPGDRSSGNLLS